MPLAEFNFGTLKYPWDDPRIADFQDNLDRVNGLGQRSAGFIWMLDEDDMEAEQEDGAGPLADRPNTASTLSVWEDAASLWHFVEKTLHSKFKARSHEWFEPDDSGHLVVWRVADGHRPTVAEGMAQWHKLQADGPDADRFDGATLRRMAQQQSA